MVQWCGCESFEVIKSDRYPACNAHAHKPEDVPVQGSKHVVCLIKISLHCSCVLTLLTFVCLFVSLSKADSQFFPALCASRLHFAFHVPSQEKARYCPSPVNVVVKEAAKSSYEHYPKNRRAFLSGVDLCSGMLQPYTSDFSPHSSLLYLQRCRQPMAVVLIFRL